MTGYENLYWYVEIENPDPSRQWYDMDGRAIRRFALSTINFWYPTTDGTRARGAYEGPYFNGRTISNGTAHYNLDLELGDLQESLPDDFWLSCMTEIARFDFTISSPWSLPGGSVSLQDWAQTVESYNVNNLNPLFTWDGALVRLYMGNGTVPGFLWQGSNTWEDVRGNSFLWTPPGGYDLSDSLELMFDGYLNTAGADPDRTAFTADAKDRRVDLPIGVPGRPSDNSTSEIVPVPIGVMTPYVDGDNWTGFPLYQKQGNTPGTNLRLASVPVNGGSTRGILHYDSSSGQIGASTQVKFSDDSTGASVASDITGATLSKSRTADVPWNWDGTEKTAFGFPVGSLVEPHTQRLVYQDDEIIGLHSRDDYPAGYPSVSATEITWSQTNPRMESRGWGDTDRSAHALGDQYRGQTTDEEGGRIDWVIYGPVSDWSDGKEIDTDPGSGSGILEQRSRGSSGDVWEFVRRSEFRSGERDISEVGMLFTNVNYGPQTYDGNPTNLRDVPCVNEWLMYIRPRRADFGTEDVLNGGLILLDFELATVGVVSPNGHTGTIQVQYKDSGGTWQTAYTEQATFANPTRSRDYSEGAISVPFGATDMDQLFDEDWIRIRVEVRSDYDAGNYYHPAVSINGLFFGVSKLSPLAGKKLYWYGEGLKRQYGAGDTVTDASGAVKSLLIHSAGYTDSEITESDQLTVKKVAGAVSEKTTLRDVLRNISSQAQMLSVFDAAGTVRMQSLTRTTGTNTLTDDDIFWTDGGTRYPDISYTTTDIMDLYTRVEVQFRLNREANEFMGSIAVDSDGFQDWTGRTGTTYRSYEWELLSADELIQMQYICGVADEYVSRVGAENKTLTVEAGWIRDRKTAESLLAKLTTWATRRRTTAVVRGPLDKWKDVRIGDRYAFGLNSNYLSDRVAGKQFIVTKKQTTPNGSGWGVSVTLAEMPEVQYMVNGV